MIGFRRATDVLADLADLPFGTVRAVCGDGPVLVLAPHPDDESLGCGGLIAQAVAAGIPVHVAVLTDGSQSHHSASYPPARLVALREAEAAAAVAVLGLPPDRLSFLRYPDAAAPRSGRRLRAAAGRLAAVASGCGARTVLSSWRHDPHCDHLSAHRMAALASRLVPLRHLSYAVWGWTLPATRWLPRAPVRGWRVDIAAELATKRRAVAAHRSQMTDLIRDDPTGFRLPEGLLALCDRPWEAYFEP